MRDTKTIEESTRLMRDELNTRMLEIDRERRAAAELSHEAYVKRYGEK